MEKLLDLFHRIAPLSPTLQQEIVSILQVREVRKKDIILRKGQVAQMIYFVETGLVRCYYHLKEKERTSWMMRESDIFLSIFSFFSREPSFEIIEAMEDGVFYGISYDQLRSLYTSHKEFNYHRAEILQRYYLESEKRNNMRMLPAYDRYKFLLDNQPDLVGRVPDKYLASYLGISVGTFSLQRQKFARSARKR